MGTKGSAPSCWNANFKSNAMPASRVVGTRIPSCQTFWNRVGEGKFGAEESGGLGARSGYRGENRGREEDRDGKRCHVKGGWVDIDK